MNISVLIVDDSEADRYLLRRVLSRCSFEVTLSEVSDGQAAIDYFLDHENKRLCDPEKFPPMVVFLDINMPRVNGFEFLEQFASIRGDSGADSTVIVMFSSSPRKEDKERSFTWSFVKNFVIKGDYSTEDLENVILNALN